MQLGKDYQQMVEFVKSYFDSHDPLGTELSTRFPFRRRFDHCLRCSIWARRIALSENANVETVMISALFHDIGKSVGGEIAQNHGDVGAQICDNYFKSIAYDKDRRDIIVRIVRNHSIMPWRVTPHWKQKLSVMRTCWMRLVRSWYSGTRWRLRVKMLLLMRKHMNTLSGGILD